MGQLGHRGAQNDVNFLDWVMWWVEMLMPRQGTLERVQEEVVGPGGHSVRCQKAEMSLWSGRELGDSDVVGHYLRGACEEERV